METGDQDRAAKGWLTRLSQYSYFDELVRGRTVLEVGCGDGRGAAFLADRGAKRIVGIDSSPGNVSLARSGYSDSRIEFRCENPDRVELEDGVVDCVLVSGEARLLRSPGVIEELRRLLAEDGHLVWSAASSDRSHAVGGASYFEFSDRLQDLFGPVRMFAQSPFVGTTVVEYRDDDFDVELDLRLVDPLPQEDVTNYIAVCGPSFPATAFSVVQLPTEGGLAMLHSVLHSDAPPLDITADARLKAEIRSKETAQARAAELRGRVSELERALSAKGAVADPNEDTVVLHPPTAEPSSSVSSATVSDQIAGAMAQHARHLANYERALADADGYNQELVEELTLAEARLVELEEQRALAVSEGDSLRESVREWRKRASLVEGELLAAANRAKDAEERQLTHERALKARLRQREAVLEQKIHELRGTFEVAQRQVEPAIDQEALRLAETLLVEQDQILAAIENGLATLAGQAAELELHTGGSSVAAKQHQLDTLAGEMGTRDAEVAVLTIGLKSLKERMKHIARKLEEVLASVGDDRDERVAKVVEDIARELRGYAQ